MPVEPTDRFAPLGRPVTSDARSNRRPFDGRVYVLVLDDLDISPLRTSLVKKWARDFVNENLGANIEPSFEPARPGEIPWSMANIDKARDTFGYAPSVDVREGLARTVAWSTGQSVGAEPAAAK